jgi:hypothetical protein
MDVNDQKLLEKQGVVLLRKSIDRDLENSLSELVMHQVLSGSRLVLLLDCVGGDVLITDGLDEPSSGNSSPVPGPASLTLFGSGCSRWRELRGAGRRMNDAGSAEQFAGAYPNPIEILN